jgi:hypothetical protein
MIMSTNLKTLDNAKKNNISIDNIEYILYNIVKEGLGCKKNLK